MLKLVRGVAAGDSHAGFLPLAIIPAKSFPVMLTLVQLAFHVGSGMRSEVADCQWIACGSVKWANICVRGFLSELQEQPQRTPLQQVLLYISKCKTGDNYIHLFASQRHCQNYLGLVKIRRLRHSQLLLSCAVLCHLLPATSKTFQSSLMCTLQLKRANCCD